MEWTRMLHSKSFLVSALFAGLLVLGEVIYQFVLYCRGIDVETSVFYKWLGVNNGLFLGNYFYMALPLLTATAYGWSIASDRETGYMTQMFSRVKRKTYFAAKYIVSFLSGGMIFSGALLLDFLLLATFSPLYRPYPADLASAMSNFSFLGGLFYEHTFLFVLAWLGTAFLWGGAMVCIAVAASMIFRKRAVVCITPFLVFTAQQLIGSYVMQNAPIQHRGNSLCLIWTNLLFAGTDTINPTAFVFCNIAVLIAVPTLFYVLKTRRYEYL